MSDHNGACSSLFGGSCDCQGALPRHWLATTDNPGAENVRTKKTKIDDRRQVLGDVLPASVTGCWYCGDIATTRDHVRARCTLPPGLVRAGPVVNACHDCNCRILVDAPLSTDVERGRRVASVLRARLFSVGPPKWTVGEAKRELAGRLRQKILATIKQYHLLTYRADFATNRWPEAE